MTYYYTYKITCLFGSLKDHYYYGQHVTSNLDDGYCGSGTKLKDYYRKYGSIEGETYTKEIISFYNNQEELNQAEYDLIGDKYETDIMCLNLKCGGDKMILSKSSRKKMSDSLKGKPSKRKGTHLSEEAKQNISKSMIGKKLSEETKKKLSESLIGKNKGKKATEETKKKLSESHKGKISWMKGKHHTEESINKNRLAKLNKTWYYDEILQKRVWVDK